MVVFLSLCLFEDFVFSPSVRVLRFRLLLTALFSCFSPHLSFCFFLSGDVSLFTDLDD